MVLQLILDKFSKSEYMLEYVSKLPAKFSNSEAEKHLRTLVDATPFDSVKASAIYHLREVLSKNVKELKGEKAEKVTAEIESLKNVLTTKYAKAIHISGLTFTDLLEGEEFAAKLKIGQPVPDIVGKDLDGVEFKLSEYRGKITMLSFWGDW